jgi:DNA polymerase-3 subunit alpha
MSLEQFEAKFKKLELPIHGVRLPEFVVEGETDGSKQENEAFLRDLCLKGWKKLEENGKVDSGRSSEYKERLDHELKVMSELGFVDYILLTWDFISHCREKEIPVGDGRGSAAGSLVLFFTGVTGVDPIRMGLYFERFISATRAKKKEIDGVTYLDGSLMCDIDCDVDYYRRGELITFLEEKYGAIKILNLNKMAGKQLIKDCGKIVAGRPESEMNEISSLIPVSYGKNMDLEEVYETVEAFKSWVDLDEYNKEAYSIALKLRGLIRNKSVHASGMAIAYGDILKKCPVELTADQKGKKSTVSSYDMTKISLMFVKIDALGLKTLSVVDEACKGAGINHEDIDINDPSIYGFLQDFDKPHGIFQLESFSTSSACKKIMPKNLDEVSAVLAIARPGAIDYIDQYASYSNEGHYSSAHPFFDDILRETGGICLFQEQTMKMANKVGFTLDESEQLRRIIGKKKKEEVEEWEVKVTDMVAKNGLDPEIGRILWKILDDSSNYSFNKCLHPQTRVQTKAGGRILAEIREGDEVLAFNIEDDSDRYVRVKEVHSSRVELFEFEMRCGKKIRCSMDHKFLCEDRKMHPMKEILKQDLSIMCKEKSETY